MKTGIRIRHALSLSSFILVVLLLLTRTNAIVAGGGESPVVDEEDGRRNLRSSSSSTSFSSSSSDAVRCDFKCPSTISINTAKTDTSITAQDRTTPTTTKSSTTSTTLRSRDHTTTLSTIEQQRGDTTSSSSSSSGRTTNSTITSSTKNTATESTTKATIYCQILKFDIMYEDYPFHNDDDDDGEDGSSSSSTTNKTASCIPLIQQQTTTTDGGSGAGAGVADHYRPSDFMYRLIIPTEFYHDHRIDIINSNLYVYVTNAALGTSTNNMMIIQYDDTQILLAPKPIIAVTPSNFGGAGSEHRYSDGTTISEDEDIDVFATTSLSAGISSSWTTGIKTISIVRITTQDEQPENSLNSIHDVLFNNDGISMKQQFYACSYGQLEYNLASESPSLPNNGGMIDVHLHDKTSSQYLVPMDIVNDAIMYIQTTYNDITSVQDIANVVIFCLPPGINSGGGAWIASAARYHWRILVNSGWCTSLSVMMHEMGHILGLLHSNRNNIVYDDKTGYMGYSMKSSTTPLRCYNGHKHYILGWYTSRTKDIFMPSSSTSATTTTMISLVAFTDFEETNGIDQYVIVNIANRLFIQYNRAEGMNIDTGDYKNRVTIAEDVILEDGVSNNIGSELVAGLTIGERYVHPQFNNTDLTLIVEVCDQMFGTPDIMFIAIQMTTTPPATTICGNSQSQKDVEPEITTTTRPSTSSPTSKPTQMPLTPRPTRRPTPRPTRRPTPRPTPRPTSRPTPRPTRRPSPAPTTQKPITTTMRPTPRPTPVPTTISPVVSTSAPTTVISRHTDDDDDDDYIPPTWLVPITTSPTAATTTATLRPSSSSITSPSWIPPAWLIPVTASPAASLPTTSILSEKPTTLTSSLFCEQIGRTCSHHKDCCSDYCSFWTGTCSYM